MNTQPLLDVAEQHLAVATAEQEHEPIKIAPQLPDVVDPVADKAAQRLAEPIAVSGNPIVQELQQLRQLCPVDSVQVHGGYCGPAPARSSISLEGVCHASNDQRGQYPTGCNEYPTAHWRRALREPRLLLTEVDYWQERVQRVCDRLELRHNSRSWNEICGIGQRKYHPAEGQECNQPHGSEPRAISISDCPVQKFAPCLAGKTEFTLTSALLSQPYSTGVLHTPCSAIRARQLIINTWNVARTMSRHPLKAILDGYGVIFQRFVHKPPHLNGNRPRRALVAEAGYAGIGQIHRAVRRFAGRENQSRHLSTFEPQGDLARVHQACVGKVQLSADMSVRQTHCASCPESMSTEHPPIYCDAAGCERITTRVGQGGTAEPESANVRTGEANFALGDESIITEHVMGDAETLTAKCAAAGIGKSRATQFELPGNARATQTQFTNRGEVIAERNAISNGRGINTQSAAAWVRQMSAVEGEVALNTATAQANLSFYRETVIAMDALIDNGAIQGEGIVSRIGQLCRSQAKCPMHDCAKEVDLAFGTETVVEVCILIDCNIVGFKGDSARIRQPRAAEPKISTETCANKAHFPICTEVCVTEHP